MATYDPFDPFGDRYRGGDYSTVAYTDAGSDIASVYPRHVGARIMTTGDGDIIWRPAADIFETETDIVIHCDLPGVPRDEIKIDLRGETGELVIHGEHKKPEGFESATARVRERRIGRFRKIVRLPSGVNTEGIGAKYEDGMLEVKIPKAGEFKGKKIEIA